MKAIFLYMALLTADLLVLTYVSLSGEPVWFVWINSLLMVFLTLGMAMMYRPDRYPWFVSFHYLKPDSTESFGRTLIWKPYKKMTPLRVTELEQKLKKELNVPSVVLINTQRLSN